ncbi:MAG: helix-turn-helix domain-containing protein [Rhodospirillaceae bacterium]|nr:helix-turn-helix domain-containing protein [Rhodospirillaceae bacterium]MBT5945000.1 helix-turn-helix domain-containing protein [Rhodospirillaceae bacterium]MBT6535492.1 helix-turn-helix domain-containing protein [Rhodospirillaceae bacterium]MBT7360810.1 helix-turn-helix domain-containing protein [Rhodospirillaceae bacterium]
MVRLNPRSFRVLNQDGASDMMHPVEGGDHVGAFLREARETTGRTVADVAQNLRIRRVYLEAIEDGRFDELPGATYAVGFVRSYAAYLRLDAPSLVARFKEEASGIQAPQELEFPTPVPEGRFPGGLLVTVCLLLGAAAFGGWYWYQSQNGIEVARVPAPPGDAQVNPETSAPPPGISTPDTSAPVASPNAEATAGSESIPFEGPMSAPDDSAPVTDEPEVPLVPPSYLQPQGDPLASMVDVPTLAEAAAAAAPAAAEAPAQAVEVAETPAPDVISETTPADSAAVETTTANATVADTMAADTPADEPAPVTEVAVATPAPAEFSSEPAIIALPEIEEPQASTSDNPSDREGRTYGARNAAARIILIAEENTWVQVRDKEENVVLTQMLQAGDRYLVPNRSGLRLMTGNAGGLDISVDGDSVPAIGERGESRRDVRLDPDLLKTGAAVVR